MQQNRSRNQLLHDVTPYPWRRDHRGDLCGAGGEPIYFHGIDAVVIEHSPELAEALGTIRATAASQRHDPAGGLEKILEITAGLLEKIEKAEADHTWCRGIVLS